MSQKLVFGEGLLIDVLLTFSLWSSLVRRLESLFLGILKGLNLSFPE